MALLQDFEEWREANPGVGFNLVSYVHATMSSNGMPTDLLIAVARIVWPIFVRHEGMVLLEDQVSAGKLASLKGLPKHEVEYWVNLITVDGLFSYGQKETMEQDISFGKILVESWSAKLRRDFPGDRFDVKLLIDDDVGDVAVTFISA